MSPLSNLQALAIAAVSQVVAVAVALLWITTTEGQIIVSAAGAVIALAVAFYQYVETQKTVAAIQSGSIKVTGSLHVK
jgi:hypothetical protein